MFHAELRTSILGCSRNNHCRILAGMWHRENGALWKGSFEHICIGVSGWGDGAQEEIKEVF